MYLITTYSVTTITGAHLDKENQIILQNGNEEFQLQLFEPIRFEFNTTFQHGIKLKNSIPLYNM